jgi:hypothetical protein
MILTYFVESSRERFTPSLVEPTTTKVNRTIIYFY